MNRQTWRIAVALVAAVAGAPAPHADAQTSKWVTTGVTGRLIYVPDPQGDRIPNFSMVGYGAGLRAIPETIPIAIHIDPVAGDNTQHIQDAINFAASKPLGTNGFRGVVELGPGKFNVDGHLTIGSSGILLRGAGGGDNLAANTHIVSQNRTDSIASPSTPVISIQGSSSGVTRGPQIQIIDEVVPVGAQSFRVASTTGMSVGGMVEIFRPSTQAWIEALGMHLIPDGKEWHAGDRDLDWQRTITRIEGDRVFIDAPLTTALDVQWGGGTIRTYSAPNRIRNVGVENLRGQSLDTREEANESRTPSFVRFTRVDDGFVRDVETRHFPYASVYTSETDGTQHITVDHVNSRLPSGEVTGGRRYTFAMDGQYSLVKNSTADSGRHDFVTGSDVTGPIVFYNSTTTSTRADAGPHHRWGNGLLFDNVTIGGNAINVQNRWTSGSGHGWAGANVVIWNSVANSFIAQSPPTAQTWLVGSTGAINAGDDHLPSYDATGYYDSHGTRVVTGGKQSLYEAQLSDAQDIRTFHWTGGAGLWSDAAKWDQEVTPGVYAVSERDYLLGDIDNFSLDAGSSGPDFPAIDPAWSAAIAAASPHPRVGFDSAAANQNAAFTVSHQLGAGERVVHASLALSLKQSGGSVADDFLQLLDSQASHRLSFASLGWSPQINATTPFVGVVDMGPFLNQLQTGAVNVWVSDNTRPDWAIYSATVATPKADPGGAAVFLDGGQVRVDGPTTAIGFLQNGGAASSELTLGAGGVVTVNDDFVQATSGALVFEIGGPSPGQYGRMAVGDQTQLAGKISLRTVGGFSPAINSSVPIVSTLGGVVGAPLPGAVVRDLATGAVWGIEYQSRAVVATFVTSVFGDLTSDQAITVADWTQFKAGYGVNLAGANGRSAYLLGDLDGDGDHDLTDYAQFRTAFDAAHGAGAFDKMLSVPEPTSAALAIVATIAAVSRFAPTRIAGPTRFRLER